MIVLKFPPLNKLVMKNTAELEELDPKRGIAVLNGYAVVMSHRSIIFFDLHSYFVHENKITDPGVMDDLKEVIDFMNGNLFLTAFWEELTKGAAIEITDSETMKLKGVVHKDLHYEQKPYEQSVIIEALKQSMGDPMPIPRSALYVEPLLEILSKLGPKVKKDTIALEYVGVNTSIRFTFDESPWIYGIISADPMVTNKGFMFSALGILYAEINGE